MKIAIIAYNAGNIQSVLYALKRLGHTALVTADEKQLRAADRVIFPGVGNAGAAMDSLRGSGLDQIIPALQQPVLGICVGMQLLGMTSEESDTQCLGIIPARVKKFVNTSAERIKVPQVGWNTIRNFKGSLLEGVAENVFVYYVHSFYMELCENTVAASDYILPYSAAVSKDNFYGVQFHAEKSGAAGDRIIQNFLKQ
ncbi:MAG: imidazole glycerol phosphate synthase subunit hisH [Ferruginibacter sp.]|nr:imidazole glycerol phosphate synthase subunit hisH [Ferruginibacter sp.]